MGPIGAQEGGVRIVTRYQFVEGWLERVGDDVLRRPFQLLLRYRDGTVLVKEPPRGRELKPDG